MANLGDTYCVPNSTYSQNSSQTTFDSQRPFDATFDGGQENDSCGCGEVDDMTSYEFDESQGYPSPQMPFVPGYLTFAQQAEGWSTPHRTPPGPRTPALNYPTPDPMYQTTPLRTRGDSPARSRGESPAFATPPSRYQSSVEEYGTPVGSDRATPRRTPPAGGFASPPASTWRPPIPTLPGRRGQGIEVGYMMDEWAPPSQWRNVGASRAQCSSPSSPCGSPKTGMTRRDAPGGGMDTPPRRPRAVQSRRRLQMDDPDDAPSRQGPRSGRTRGGRMLRGRGLFSESTGGDIIINLNLGVERP